MAKVTIIQSRLTHYRVPLFELTRQLLQKAGIELSVLYSAPCEEDKAKKDTGTLAWAEPIGCYRYKIHSTELLWQNGLACVTGEDLVVVTNESRLLLNYLLLAQRNFSPRKLAFWGHGRNFQAENSNNLKDWWKNLFLCCPDWWFGYSSATYDILHQAGYPPDRITILENAVDTQRLLQLSYEITPDDLDGVRSSLGIVGANVGVYCGSIYKGKKLDMVVASAVDIRIHIPDFELIIIGSGPDDHIARDAAARFNWIRWVGNQFDREKALYMKLGHILLLPYGVGLAILDSFVLGVPVCTIENESHGPEIAYLKNQENGMLTNANEYVDGVVSLLKNRQMLDLLKAGCLRDASKYTIENMAKNFADGIVQCLEQPKRLRY